MRLILQFVFATLLFCSSCSALASQSLITSKLSSKNTQFQQPRSKISEYSFKAIDNKRLDLIGGVWAIEQDSLGFIWFGGENGLARFDGYDVVIFRHDSANKDSLSSSYIRDLLVDSDGQLWVATNYGLNAYIPESETFIRYHSDAKNENSLSGNNIHSLEEDQFGSLWIATGGSGLTRYDKDLQRFEHFRHNSGDASSLSSDGVYTVMLDDSGSLWVGTINGGLDQLLITPTLNPVSARFSHFRHLDGNSLSISSDSILSIHQDRLSNIWVATSNGLNLLDNKKGVFTRFFTEKNSPYTFTQTIGEDLDGNLWFAHSGYGINQYSLDTGVFTAHTHKPGNPGSIFNNNVRAFLLDRDGNFWLGHFASGVSMLDRYAGAFTNYYHSPMDDNTLDFSEVVSVAEDSVNNLWVGTSRGLNYLDRNTGLVKRYRHDPNDQSGISDTGVLGTFIDSKERLWVGFWGGGINRLDDESDSFKHYRTNVGAAPRLSSNYVWAFGEDSDGRVWVGTHNMGLSYYDEFNDSFIKLPKKQKGQQGIDCDSVFSIFVDQLKSLWVGCSNGLHLRTQGTLDFTHFRHEEGNPNSLSADHVWGINEDASGTLWVGTQGGGVNYYNRKTQQFGAYRVKDGLSDDLVTGILQADNGELWFSTGNGVSKLSLRDVIFKIYDKTYGLSGDVFNRAASLKSKAGELIFGSKDGLTIINPSKLSTNTVPPEVVITDFKLFNKSIDVSTDKGSVLTVATPLLRELILNYEQSSFSFQFSALNYRNSANNEYAYRLDGFDEQWNYVSHRRSAYYTKLDPGEYVFRVKGTNNEGVWSINDRTINVTILPPWWHTWWSYLLYGFLLLLMILGVVYALWQQGLARNERRVSERLRAISKGKDRFLANTSHELRMPLQGMIGLAESLKGNVNLMEDQQAQNQLNMLALTGKRLSHLVNDILDYSKLREREISLRLMPVDIYSVVEVVLVLFQPLLEGKLIVVQNRVSQNLPLAMADEDRLQQILYNLIGNAVKFTDDGSIKLSANVSDSFLRVSVQDTGVGISPSKCEKIFTAYEQGVEDASKDSLGTGLGLSVTKQLVELHGGEIFLDSVSGKGSCFSFTLPLSKVTHKPTVRSGERITGEEPNQATLKVAEPTVHRADVCLPERVLSKGYHVLIVDDEPVNRMVIESFLKTKCYRISQCSSGLEALDFVASNSDLSLVLLDIMMPRLSGFETCKKIRANYTQDELPVIFLTGMNRHIDLKTGYSVGGNDFLTKPVTKEELLSRVETQLLLADKTKLT